MNNQDHSTAFDDIEGLAAAATKRLELLKQKDEFIDLFDHGFLVRSSMWVSWPKRSKMETSWMSELMEIPAKGGQ